MSKLDNMPIDELTINTIRTLSMDAVQKANSGHPGTPMALAPLAYLLYKKVMRHNPTNPHWINRDRFVLSAGHASMLLYSVLHLTGYEVSLDDLKEFRQLESITPGHPEYGEAPGVETTTGPLGQGISNTVGMAMAEAHLASIYNKDDYDIIDHFTYAICGDGDLMEGVSHEAASLAGHLGLGKLIWFYDDNHISIEGETDLAYSDNVPRRFEGYNWHVIDLGEKANDLQAISKAIETAQQVTDKPSLIIVRSHIGYGAPNLQDTHTAHGAPLGEEEIALTKEFYGWPKDEQFLVPERVKEHMREVIDSGKQHETTWNQKFDEYKSNYPELAAQLQDAFAHKLPDGWDSEIPEWTPEDGAQATRNVSGNVINAIASKVPYLVGGSADLAPSTKTLMKHTNYFNKEERHNRNIAWGVREFGMAGATSGIALHGGLRPFCATFFVFTDYARPAMRLAALMKLPVIYVMTHDSIGVGEDGPTHQPVEHLLAMRSIPNMTVFRPGDANEVAYAWRYAIAKADGPVLLALTRQGIPTFDRNTGGAADGVLHGGYVLVKEKGSKPDVILLGTGSELQLAVDAQAQLAIEDIDARVVSLPSWEVFRAQSDEYKEQVLPSDVKARVSVEAGVTLGWHEFVGNSGIAIGIDQFGASGPYKKVFPHFGFTVENVVKQAKTLV